MKICTGRANTGAATYTSTSPAHVPATHLINSIDDHRLEHVLEVLGVTRAGVALNYLEPLRIL